MAFVYRVTKDAPLTHEEVDGNLQHVEDLHDAALDARDDAVAAQTAAEAAETAADSSATAAAGSASTASSAASSASASATAAGAAETAAASAADKAKEWADKAEDEPVETDPDRFSARHWAAKAASVSDLGEHVAAENPHPQYATGGAQDTHSGRDDNPHGVTAAQAGADPTGTAAGAVSAHVGESDPHTQYVKKDGDTMTGALEMPDLRLITAGNLSSDSIEINFSQGHAYMTRWVGGNVAFTSTGFLNGVTRTIRLANAGASRTLTFPSAWRFVGPKPTAIGAGNHAVLTVTCFAGTEDSVIAAYAEEIA